MTKYLDIYELAELLGKRPETLHKDMRRNARAVPPKMHIPETKMLRWRENEAKSWLEEQKAQGLRR